MGKVRYTDEQKGEAVRRAIEADDWCSHYGNGANEEDEADGEDEALFLYRTPMLAQIQLDIYENEVKE